MQIFKIKRTMARVATLVVMVFTTVGAWAQFSGGNGSEGNPYEIASYDDLLTLRNNVNNGNTYKNCYFRQTANIDWPDGTIFCKTEIAEASPSITGSSGRSLERNTAVRLAQPRLYATCRSWRMSSCPSMDARCTSPEMS